MRQVSARCAHRSARDEIAGQTVAEVFVHLAAELERSATMRPGSANVIRTAGIKNAVLMTAEAPVLPAVEWVNGAIMAYVRLSLRI